MLVILNEKKYDEFKKSKKKPSDYCADNLRLRDVKSYDFVTEYFSDIGKLLSAIKKYVEISRIPKGEYSLLDLVDSVKMHVQ